MEESTKLYKNITMDDGRKGVIVDYLGDCLIVETMDGNQQWELVEVYFDGNDYCVCDDGSKLYNLCSRKGIRLLIGADASYTFIFSEIMEGEECTLSQNQYDSLCKLLEIDAEDMERNWNHFFEYNNMTIFNNAIKIVSEENGFYYAYGMNHEEKTADALYRCINGTFERYLPVEGIWREMPEQRMVLKEKKARYTVVTEEEGLALALLK